MAKAYFGNGAPFSRALSYNQALVRLTTGENKVSLTEAVAKLGVYVSRGHGRAKNSGLTVAKAQRSAYFKLRGRYQEVHQGEREIARRLRQNHGLSPESKPVRRWWADSCDGYSWVRMYGAKSLRNLRALAFGGRVLAFGSEVGNG